MILGPRRIPSVKASALDRELQVERARPPAKDIRDIKLVQVGVFVLVLRGGKCPSRDGSLSAASIMPVLLRNIKLLTWDLWRKNLMRDMRSLSGNWWIGGWFVPVLRL